MVKDDQRSGPVRKVSLVLLLVGLLVATTGASGVFAFVLCPACDPVRRPMPLRTPGNAPAKPLPEELQKGDGK